MCDICNKNHGIIEISLSDKNGTKAYCPNCLLIGMVNNKIILENNDDLICDITNKKGAIKYSTYMEEYILEKEILTRLIYRNLNPSEYFKLTEKYNENNYMLHEDFYAPDTGEAYQPVE